MLAILWDECKKAITTFHNYMELKPFSAQPSINSLTQSSSD